ncbi:3-deoxy-D-arabinoheptulosonate-7-phosphate synthase [Ferrimonas balearica DSM 9799]|uniref:Phospho-2-dehydro-3-deoxyheptonate aldolase n=1 Tax=Ferrimonas balearica (strain DSM 9799 / CCM 4581 / KCTC 23876 / PAT) TaxID=550540 RepID=E1SRY5_FERBD|nr:3-deoxy-7-phosphoheptulonate synthase [Ferrimonas balearica]MBY6018914.1 3-deoxy-7-phosphoheptulonate synthase [Halomonas denitrificans]ADN74954.1 3-deoxy-D-arabinoheptulosonate-7-phosphate synthase [Ferrimonas balearica DSM 9799]MBW3140757.1 3-deoxy-7-phosphoheptulonate synthase [Ferrimonas balearica]MBW3165266.1 3-deoxy-7-phosphoheptulonate synthase [Ferrimonas balearica]MBY5981523.1 3-deoxy-7-phosphoheptulonate synthase [Ferrimonas balearica]
MQKDSINNIHIDSERVLITPAELKAELPLSDHAYRYILDARQTVADIVHKRDNRILVVAGPCSIHDVEAAKEYALKLKTLHEELKDQFYILMRVYFEKPRTTVGWKGLINDPDMDGSFNVEKGLRQARELLIWLAELELPVATEALDPISPQYLSELFAWSAIGARTTESQTHREMASGLSMPVGFKNGTDGKLDVAINALQAAAHSHRFMGINQAGQVALLQTQGNPDGHVILRGGKQPNYDSVNVALCAQELHAAGLNARLVIDCSHGNSSKDPARQPLVAQNVFHQILDGNTSIIGIMLESHLKEGAQSADTPRDQLEYGLSITDACIDWATTESLLRVGAEALGPMLPQRFKEA